MKTLIETFKESLHLLKKDKVSLLYAFVPIFVGAILYFFLGKWIYSDVLTFGKEWLESSISSEGWGSFFYYIFISILTIAFYFIISWTFVLLVSLLASPFNDLLSARIEKLVQGKEPDSLSESFGKMILRLGKIIWNEIKKITLILFFTILAFLLSLVPVLSPISVAISAFLMAASFLDYSWSRHDMASRSCLNDIRTSFLPFGFSGGLFLAWVTIPLLNLFALPFGVVYYTVFFTKKYDGTELWKKSL